MPPRFTTGMDTLDRLHEGGVPSGNVVALLAPPESQSELLVNMLTAQHEALYLSTTRTADAVEDGLGRAATDTNVVYLGASPSPDDLTSALSHVPENGLVVVDQQNPLEDVSRREYVSMVNALQRRLRESGSIAMLHCTGDRKSTPRRDVTLVAADIVWTLDLRLTTYAIENRLAVTKFRGGRALREPVKLQLTDGVRVDTSRDIA
ncbi:RAD55 family ATPase [Haloarchaeobius sp. TZWWS8]|uniref:RAD55 family ATPase n=1 Tax=Haloarchaeobius sp. TZWWS8 TaxID=3446121 RepID=UPI003EB7D0E4